jgi:hypothetical protein
MSVLTEMSAFTFSVLIAISGLTFLLALPGERGRKWRFGGLTLWKRALVVAVVVATAFFGRHFGDFAALRDPRWTPEYPIGIWVFFVAAFALRDRRLGASQRFAEPDDSTKVV